MNNLQISLAVYLHILTCITVMFYFWNKIINGLVKSQNNNKNIQKSNWYETNLEIMKKAHKDVEK